MLLPYLVVEMEIQQLDQKVSHIIQTCFQHISTNIYQKWIFKGTKITYYLPTHDLILGDCFLLSDNLSWNHINYMSLHMKTIFSYKSLHLKQLCPGTMILFKILCFFHPLDLCKHYLYWSLVWWNELTVTGYTFHFEKK